MEKAQRAIGQDEPVMIAWNKHKATDDYANTLRWAGASNEGNLWAVFYAGFGCSRETSAEVASIAGELINVSADDLDNVAHSDVSARDQLLEKIRKLAASALSQRAD